MIMNKVIDIHIHIMGAGDSGKGCRTSPGFLSSPVCRAMLLGLDAAADGVGDDWIRESILREVSTSETVDYAVVLALDGVHKNGRYIPAESHVVVPNDYVIEMARRNSRILFGASVHPYRQEREMLHETKRCIDEGAVIFKWAPSGQQIDPEDDRCIPFYLSIARAGVPLMCNTGSEFALSSYETRTARFNHPVRLQRALDIGVKVIASHSASPWNEAANPEDGSYFNDLIDMLRVSDAKGWELYADLSAFCRPGRGLYLERIKREIREGSISAGRFLYGSDFPVPAVDINRIEKPLGPRELREHIKTQGNMLDSNYRILKEFGIPDQVFTNAGDVL
jgi:predicted TIM-barrel fold metal-dependent hydrolase